jgi:hypothetical protein
MREGVWMNAASWAWLAPSKRQLLLLQLRVRVVAVVLVLVAGMTLVLPVFFACVRERLEFRVGWCVAE